MAVITDTKEKEEHLRLEQEKTGKGKAQLGKGNATNTICLRFWNYVKQQEILKEG